MFTLQNGVIHVLLLAFYRDYRIFSKNSALHNFVTHSFVSKKSLKFDEMAIF